MLLAFLVSSGRLDLSDRSRKINERKKVKIGGEGQWCSGGLLSGGDAIYSLMLSKSLPDTETIANQLQKAASPTTTIIMCVVGFNTR